VDDQKKDDADRAPRAALAAQIIRAIALATLLTGAAWIAASYAFDWAGPTFR
jgi:hypothetical protein